MAEKPKSGTATISIFGSLKLMPKYSSKNGRIFVVKLYENLKKNLLILICCFHVNQAEVLSYCVISATFLRVQMLIAGSRESMFSGCVTFVLIKSETMKATKYVDIFGVIPKSSRT